MYPVQVQFDLDHSGTEKATKHYSSNHFIDSVIFSDGAFFLIDTV